MVNVATWSGVFFSTEVDKNLYHVPTVHTRRDPLPKYYIVQILEAADLIYKLQMLSSELPQGDREKK